MAWPVCFYDLIREWTDLSWHIDLNGNLSDPVPWIRKLNSGGGKTFKRGPFTLSSVCAVIFSDSPRVSCVCVWERDRYWLMFLKFTWHLTGLVKSKQITLALGLGDMAQKIITIIIFISVDIDNYHDKCQIFISFKFKAIFLLQSESFRNQTIIFP